MRRLAILPIAILVLAACQPADSGESATESASESAMESHSMSSEPAATDGGTSGTGCDNASGDDMLAQICEAGVILVATDPAYPPQSELLPDGTYEGFDIDAANELGERLGVEVQFETPNFDEVVAGSWAGRFDISVGSVTITEEREAVLGFTQAYYYTPAQMFATSASGITDLDGLAGMTVCVGEATTYQSWLEGTLTLAGNAPDPSDPPEGAEVTTFSTDTECADSVASGRTDFEGWLTSSTTGANAITAGAEFVEVGEPVFFEPLAVAVDLSEEGHESLLAELDRIVGEMHEDGTLSGLSETWFDGLDLTTE
ncbi:MAG: transporter substrate-binding domain-containing protein [Candidatus Limnocylindria bacterium]